MVRGLLQREVSQELGICTSTYCNWEVGRTEPEIRYLPAIYALLGFCPFDPAWSFGERLRAAREAQGLSRKEIGRLAGLDPGTIARAERDVGGLARKPTRAVRTVLRPARDHFSAILRSPRWRD
ncbi:MAG: helix-turn-helix domain-containing protein [Proteobacteria bacterium]|nr:helix-turn-helix domain-containing protein [Pseudomonadota bacterium]